MQFCPECGAKLEPGDTFCINCGVSLEDTGVPASQKTEKTPVHNSSRQKKKFNPAPIIIVAGILVILIAAFAIGFNLPGVVLLRAAKKTEKAMSEFESVKSIEVLMDGGSLEASADLTEFLTGLTYLDAIDAKADARIGFNKDDKALVINTSANVANLSALDAVIWLTPEKAFLSSPTLLGNTPYKVDMTDYYSKGTAKLLSGILEKSGTDISGSLRTLIINAFLYGESSKEKADDKTFVYLTLDRKSAEKVLLKTFDLKAELPADFLLRLCFGINEDSCLYSVRLKNNSSAGAVSSDQKYPDGYTLTLDNISSDGYELTFSAVSDIYEGVCTCEVTADNTDKLNAKTFVLLNGNETAKASIEWNRLNGNFSIKSGSDTITPKMTLKLNPTENYKSIPSDGTLISLTSDDDLYSVAGNLGENAGLLIGKLGYVLPFSLQDTVFGILSDLSDTYISPLTGEGMITMTEKKFNETVQEVAVAAAQEAAVSAASAVAAETAAETASRVAAEVAASVAAEAISKANLTGTSAETTSAASDASGTTAAGDTATGNSDSSAKTSDDIYSKIAGTYVYEDGASYGVNASAKFDASGNYSLSCKSLFFNISESGTYKADKNGNMTFTSNTKYKATGKYLSNGNMEITIVGIATIELVKQ